MKRTDSMIGGIKVLRETKMLYENGHMEIIQYQEMPVSNDQYLYPAVGLYPLQ